MRIPYCVLRIAYCVFRWAGMILTDTKEAHAKTLRSKDAKKILCIFDLCARLYVNVFVPPYASTQDAPYE